MTSRTVSRREAVTLLRLALPAILTQVAVMLMGLVDSLMVSRLGTEALAAVTLGSAWVWGTLLLAMGVLFGLDPIVSQAHGGQDGRRAGRALQQGLLLSLLLSVPVAACWALTAPVLRLVGQDPELAALAGQYVMVQIPSIPAVLAFTALRQYLAGRGNFAPAMWVSWASNGVNALLDWALIFGHVGFAAGGIVGAGVATMWARWFMLAALVAVTLAYRLHEGGWQPWGRGALHRGEWRELLGHGVPTGVQVGLEVWGFQVAMFLAGLLGAVPVAAHAIVMQLASMSFMFPFGLSMAAATRVGNLMGAGDRATARSAALTSLVIGAGTMACFALTFLVLRNWLPRAWAPEPEVLALAAGILPIAAAFQVFDGTQAVGCGVLRGLGDTRPAAAFNLLGYYGLGLPLGAALAFGAGWGLQGIWWGLVLGLFTVAALLVHRILRARWEA